MSDIMVDIKALATFHRRKWGIDNYTPIDIVQFSLVNMPNLTILWLDMEDNVSGYCLKKDHNCLILINSNHSIGRQNFTLAHELYHLFYSNKNDEEDEVNANIFASHLLMPEHALIDFKYKHNIEKWTMEDLIKCEQYFKISHSALIHRLKSNGFIKETELEKIKDDVMDEAIKLGFGKELYCPSNKKFYGLGKIIRSVEKAFDNNKISNGFKEEILLACFRDDIVFNLE